jgi:hypothetical protein
LVYVQITLSSQQIKRKTNNDSPVTAYSFIPSGIIPSEPPAFARNAAFPCLLIPFEHRFSDDILFPDAVHRMSALLFYVFKSISAAIHSAKAYTSGYSDAPLHTQALA